VRTTNTADNLCAVSDFVINTAGLCANLAAGFSLRNCDGYGDLDGTVPFRNPPAVAVASGQWVHFVMRYSGANAQRTYINGLWDNNGPYVDFSRALNIPLRVGCVGPNPGELNNYFDGEIDEVAVYNKELTDAQILSHYQSALYGAGVAPFFVAPLPTSQTVVSNAGANVTFAGNAQGTFPIAYQWFFNGSAISAATTTTLARSATYSNAGVYTLRATNSAGTTNITLNLTVLPPGPSFVNVTQDLVLHLKFDGDYTDSSGRGHNGTAVGDPSIVTGRIGSGALPLLQ
jgi:hypothetical protein